MAVKSIKLRTTVLGSVILLVSCNAEIASAQTNKIENTGRQCGW